LTAPRSLPAAISTTGTSPVSAVAISLAIPCSPRRLRREPAPRLFRRHRLAATMMARRRRPREKCEMAFYELRQYKVLPGKMEEWVKIMEEEIIPFQVSKGMVITGSFRGETDDSVYVWTRRFES